MSSKPENKSALLPALAALLQIPFAHGPARPKRRELSPKAEAKRKAEGRIGIWRPFGRRVLSEVDQLAHAERYSRQGENAGRPRHRRKSENLKKIRREMRVLLKEQTAAKGAA